ncbi:uncharacterized protein METZ01_LOCUS86608 [marine metagenome]|uniref:Uncharacterized protein n=1 Tax=marine metagenome TaxID=408172 RepID=A0A381V0L6_9ZZZZ
MAKVSAWKKTNETWYDGIVLVA